MYKLEYLLENANDTQANINKKWVPARPIGPIGLSYKLKDAWAVLTGKADAFTWPEDQ